MFWWSGPARLYLFNTNTGRWHQLQNYLLWNDLLKAKPKCRVHDGVCGFTGIKLSNVGDSYLWNITSDICRMRLVWIWLLTTNKVSSSQHNVLSVRVFFIQSWRIDHKHGIMLSDHRDAGLEQIWPARQMKIYQPACWYFVTSWLRKPMNYFLMCYQLIENKGFIILDNELATGHANIW